MDPTIPSTNRWTSSTIAFATLSAFLLVSQGDFASAEPGKEGKEAEAKKQGQPAMEGALERLEQADELLRKGTHDNKNTGKNENKR